MWNLLKPAPPKEEIQNPEVVKEKYKYWRLRIFYSMFIGYIFYYFSRKSLVFAMPALMNDLGFNKAQLGILASLLSFTYGFSKFASGVISDQSNPRYFMAIGLIITGAINIFFGLSSSLWIFAIFWGLNGWFQGWGWPPCARLLTHWYSHSERGTWWSLWSTSHNIGGFLIPLVTAYCVSFFGWRYAMYIPGALCILIGFFVINRLRDTPQSLGLPPIEKHRNDYSADQKKDQEEKELSTKEILFEHVLTNKWVWLLAFASFFVYIVRMAINDWGALYLIERKSYSLIKANSCISLFEIGGLIGMLIAGFFSDKLFVGRRGPMNVLFSIGILLVVLLLKFFPSIGFFGDSLIFFMSGFFVFGPQMLIGLAAAELSHKKAAGAASGFAGWFAYLGGASAGYPLGQITQDFGWNGYLIVLSACSALSILLLIPMWGVDRESSKEIAALPSSEEST